MSSPSPITSLAQLYEALERHDWFHEMSDDYGVWERGQADWKRLSHSAKQLGPQAERLLEDFSMHHSRWFGERLLLVPKPKLEDYL